MPATGTALEIVANVMRAERERMERRNATTVGPNIPEIGLLSLIVVDTTEAIRAVLGDSAANFYCQKAHPIGVTHLRTEKRMLNAEFNEMEKALDNPENVG